MNVVSLASVCVCLHSCSLNCGHGAWCTRGCPSRLSRGPRAEPLEWPEWLEWLECVVRCAELESRAERVAAVAALAARLPGANRAMLRLVVAHLRAVAARAERNLMTRANLAVCVAPSLLRAPRESVAAILDLKFYNVLVETLLDHYDQILGAPDAAPPHNGLGYVLCIHYAPSR